MNFCEFYIAEIPRENTDGTQQYDSPSDHNTLVFS